MIKSKEEKNKEKKKSCCCRKESSPLSAFYFYFYDHQGISITLIIWLDYSMTLGPCSSLYSELVSVCVTSDFFSRTSIFSSDFFKKPSRFFFADNFIRPWIRDVGFENLEFCFLWILIFFFFFGCGHFFFSAGSTYWDRIYHCQTYLFLFFNGLIEDFEGSGDIFFFLKLFPTSLTFDPKLIETQTSYMHKNAAMWSISIDNVLLLQNWKLLVGFRVR